MRINIRIICTTYTSLNVGEDYVALHVHEWQNRRLWRILLWLRGPGSVVLVLHIDTYSMLMLPGLTGEAAPFQPSSSEKHWDFSVPCTQRRVWGLYTNPSPWPTIHAPTTCLEDSWHHPLLPTDQAFSWPAAELCPSSKTCSNPTSSTNSFLSIPPRNARSLGLLRCSFYNTD